MSLAHFFVYKIESFKINKDDLDQPYCKMCRMYTFLVLLLAQWWLLCFSNWTHIIDLILNDTLFNYIAPKCNNLCVGICVCLLHQISSNQWHTQFSKHWVAKNALRHNVHVTKLLSHPPLNTYLANKKPFKNSNCGLSFIFLLNNSIIPAQFSWLTKKHWLASSVFITLAAYYFFRLIFLNVCLLARSEKN